MKKKLPIGRRVDKNIPCPKVRCIYAYVSPIGKRTIYVGKTVNLNQRNAAHRNRMMAGEGEVFRFSELFYVEIPQHYELKVFEDEAIFRLQPEKNFYSKSMMTFNSERSVFTNPYISALENEINIYRTIY